LVILDDHPFRRQLGRPPEPHTIEGIDVLDGLAKHAGASGDGSDRPVYSRGMTGDTPPIGVEISLEPDPVIERYKQDVDRTLLRANLRRTPEERLLNLMALQRFAEELRDAGRRARQSR